ncbi:FtsX-like permease family protein [Streptomyces spectabilis]|uniref:FtsX-like permease family protein n=1 Tax=Streptomyces spectabilis TaxID=68270 RepID=A0A5P2X782_STRST|nr:FtsX-like permease family protein [Streptomyces spectabilis]MBB5101549.1 putative ABC transport system permease protein [Streptomyces spectabilis]MCI3900734.1 ABC transporter permease [Streptomyces spectabilis]QEV58272.1 FtsX-like permease family protein [Streptomyces spectabilis]GGV12077.1 membrane protein [Streptomyces spectabilis]
MFRTAWRNVGAHPSRVALTALAVSVGVAFLTGILLFTATVSDALTGAYRQTFTHTDVVIRPDDRCTTPASGHRPASLSAADVRRVEGLSQTGHVIAVVSGYTALGCPDGRSAGRGGPARAGNYAGSADKNRADPRYRFTRGRPPAKRGEIAIDEDSAAQCGYRPGDTARISVNGPGLTARISGVFTTRAEPALTAGGSLVLFDSATAQQHFTGRGRFSELHVQAAPGISAEQLEAASEERLPGTLPMTAASLARERALAGESAVAGLRATLLSFAAIALFISCFLITNTFSMLVTQRTREIGLLRAVGASRCQVTRLVLTEAFLVALAASLVGVALGIGVAEALRSFAGDVGKSGPLPSGGALSLPAYALLLPLFTGVATTLVAAWLPARAAARIAPLAALRATPAPAPAGTGRGRVLLGLLLATGGVACLLAGARTNRIQDGAPVLALGAILIAGGLLALMPTLVAPALALARPLLARAGISARLAARNSARAPRRTAAAAASLVIGVSLVTALTMIAAGGLAAANAQSAHVLTADYVVSMQDLSPLSDTVARRLAASPHVTTATAMRETQLTIDQAPQSALALPASALRDLLRPHVTSGSADHYGGRNILVTTDDARAYGWIPGSRLRAKPPGSRPVQLTVAGVYEPNTLLAGILIDTATLPKPTTSSVEKVFLTTRGHPGPALRTALTRALGDSPALRIDSSDDLARAAAQDTHRMLNLLYTLLALSIAVAFLGIINTLALSVAERQRELGMLRAIGLTRAGVRGMVRAEALLITVFAGVLGAGLGIFLGWAGGELIARHLPGYHHSVPAARLAALLVLAVCAGLPASLWPARRAAHTPVLTAIGTQ